MLEIKTYQSLSEVDPGLWNSVMRRDNVISSWEHLMAVEQSHINDCVYRYVMAFEDGRPVANACFYYISFDLDIFNRGVAKKIIGFIRRHFIKTFLRLRVIECGTPTAMGNTVNWADGQDPAAVFGMVVRQMELFAAEMKVGILILRDFIDKDLPFSDSMLRLKFKRVGILPNAYVINNWSTFEGYMGDLASKYKMSVRRYLRILKEHSAEVRIFTSYGGMADRLLDLWKQCYDHAREYQREVLTREYFVNMDRYMQGKTKLMAVMLGEKIVGYSLSISGEDTLHGLFAGMDYQYVRELFLLFNLYAHTVKLGIEEGAKVVEMGLTTTYEKLSFGSTLVPMFAYMRHLSPVVNPILSNLFVLFSESTRFDSRKIFNRRYYERIYTNSRIMVVHEKGLVDAELYDISLSGARIFVKGGLPAGRFGLRFDFPNSLNDFTVQAKPVWRKEDSGGTEAGIRFKGVNAGLKESLNRYVMVLGEENKKNL